MTDVELAERLYEAYRSARVLSGDGSDLPFGYRLLDAKRQAWWQAVAARAIREVGR